MAAGAEVPTASVAPEAFAAGSNEAPAFAATVISDRERTVVEEYRARITKIYIEKQPSKVEEIEKFLERYKGQEHILYVKICKRYSVVEESEYKGNSPFGGGLKTLGAKTGITFPLAPLDTAGALACRKNDEVSTLREAPVAPSPIPSRVACNDADSKEKPVVSASSDKPISSDSVAGTKAGPISVILASNPSSSPNPFADAPGARFGDGASTPMSFSSFFAPPAQSTATANFARDRSRSPRQQAKQSVQSVWIATCVCDSPQQHLIQAVRSSKELATAAAKRAMDEKKAELGGKDFGDVSIEGDVVCGFTSKADGKEANLGSYRWRVTSHDVLE